MKGRILLFLIAGSLALYLTAEPVLACPSYLQCANFTESTKIADCEYAVAYAGDQQGDIICNLWDQSYESIELYETPSYPPLDVDLSLEANEIDNSSFILAGKILVFGFLNYFIFSLTKSSWLLKWLIAGS